MNSLAALVRDFYDARRRNDEDAIRSLLADDVVWHEPKVNHLTGDLVGADAVLRMMREALALTNGTFALTVTGVMANQSHAVALIDWTAVKSGSDLKGSEFAVFRISDSRIREAWFFQQDMQMDRAFWGAAGS